MRLASSTLLCYLFICYIGVNIFIKVSVSNEPNWPFKAPDYLEDFILVCILADHLTQGFKSCHNCQASDKYTKKSFCVIERMGRNTG